MSQPVVGAPRSRVEGPHKVTGRTAYTADNALPGMLHAVVVESTVANGRIAEIDDSRAHALPGVVAVMTHRNAPRVNPKKSDSNDSLLFLLQDDAVEFDRQPVAVAIADTFERATYAAQRVRVRYEARPPVMDLEAGTRFVPEQIFGSPAQHRRGAPDDALAHATTTFAQTYRTPTEHHNPMETHATIAQWSGDRLTLHDATQWVFGVQQRLATVFGIDPKQIRVIAPWVGGAFGGKGQAWSHVALAAMAAKLVKRPVRLVVTRQQMFGWVGHRPQTKQVVHIGASRDGALQALKHEVLSETSVSDEFVEPSVVFSRDLYAVANYGMTDTLSRLNIGKPTYQRGPGESTGSFAIESAMDELSYELGIDPLELRLRNYAVTAPDSGRPYSSKRLRDCYLQAAERFNWSARKPKVRATARGRVLVGWGMATASRATHRSACSARMRANADGTFVLQCGTIEQGTGSPTVYPQLAAEILGVSPDRVRLELGDTNLPQAPIAAGSQTAASVGAATIAAARRMREALAAHNGAPPASGITVEAQAQPDEGDEKYATQAFGAHFAEVELDPELGTVRVTRFVAAFDGGRILNPKTARSQLLGGVVWGISMALFEDTRYDARLGRIVNANLSEYLVPTNADVPDVELLLVPSDDRHAGPAGVKGIGEVGICGSAAAVANAVYHASGIRVRDLPIVPEKLLA